MMQLKVNGEQAQLHPLCKPTYLIGRSAACNIRVTDDGIRPVHACLKVDDGGVRILQQDDAPVRVNGAALQSEALLTHGDIIVLGDTTLTVLNADEHAVSDGNKAANSAEMDDPIDEPEAPDDSSDHTLVRNVEGPSWSLHGLSRALGGKKFDIRLAALVGRAKECDIRLGEAHLSRRHARLTVTDKGLLIEDLDSANGTFINGRRIQQATVRSGDEVSFDTLKFRIKQHATAGEGDETRIRPAIQEPLPRSDNAHAASVAHAREEQGDPRHDTPAEAPPAQPVGPTAIESQHAALRRLREEREQRAGVSEPARRGVRGGWLAVAVIALVGVLWGATSFLQVAPQP